MHINIGFIQKNYNLIFNFNNFGILKNLINFVKSVTFQANFLVKMYAFSEQISAI